MQPSLTPSAEPVPATNWYFKCAGWVILGLIMMAFIGKLTMLALLAGVGFVAAGVVQTLIQRKSVSWENVKDNGMVAVQGIGRGCQWAYGKARGGVSWAKAKGGPTAQAAKDHAAAGWHGCCSKLRMLGSIAVETLSGAGLGGLVGGALTYAVGMHDSVIPLAALIGAGLGFFAGVYWRPRTIETVEAAELQEEPKKAAD